MKKSPRLRLAACLTAAVMVIGPLPSWADAVAAAPDIPAKSAVQQFSPAAGSTAVSLEKAISIAKEKIPVPEELDMFNSDYHEINGKGRWMLRWHSSGQPESSMGVTVSADTGEVGSVDKYTAIKPGVRYQGLPAFSRDQCLNIAREEAKRLQPDKYLETVLSNREQLFGPSLLRERDYPIIYDFNFKRTYSGIQVADQGLNVGINAETGEVVRYNSNWNGDSKLPQPEGRISAEQAKALFTEKAGYELTYFMFPGRDPDVPGDLRLVYRPKPPGRFVVNALTGEVADPGTMDFYSDDMMGGGGSGGGMMSASKSERAALTPTEVKAVKETQDLISADRAQEIAAKLMEAPKGYTASGRNLERHYGVPGSRVWSIRFTDADSKNVIMVSVDARTGDLVSFNRDARMNPADYYQEPGVKVSQDDARKAAEALIKKMQPDRFSQVVFRQSDPEIGPLAKMGKVIPRGYMFSYARSINGVVYPENGFRVRVNSTTGEVSSYEVTWWDTSFPGAEGVVGIPAANEKFLAEHPLALEYSRGHKRYVAEKEEPAYYLIYRPTGGMPMLDAISGQAIGYDGKPVAPKGKQAFSDISGHPSEQDIALLAGEGIISGDGGKFRPDDRITVAEMLSMLVKAYSNRGPYYPLAENSNQPWYQPVIDNARARGILDEGLTLSPEAGLKRSEIARLGVNAGGWGKLARLSDIFRLEVADSNSIPPEYRGYIAAALGLGLLSPEGGGFSPDKAVTRAEAASFLVRLMKQ